MLQGRRVLIWLVAGAGLALFLFLGDPSSSSTPTEVATLPDDEPDVYMTDMELTRFNEQGTIAMVTYADTMSVYNDTGLTRLTKPRVTLYENEDEQWRITANEANVYENEDIEFASNVIAVQTNDTPPLIIASEELTIRQSGTFITSDTAVQILQGRQTIDAIGMEVDLQSDEPVIHLLEEVSFSYDPT
jgi:LPS export ABC transporter protein LptC